MCDWCGTSDDTIVLSHISAVTQSSVNFLKWATKRFLAGGATKPFADVFAYAAAQVKHSLEIAKRLDAESYVFWGGREGYESLLNTDTKRELAHIAKFFKLAKLYAKEIGYTGQFLLEPKPKEPTAHQYGTDGQTTIAFLKTYDLDNIYKERYASFDTGIGADFENDKATFADFEAYILNKTNEESFATVESGHLEAIKATLNNYIYSVLGSTFNK